MRAHATIAEHINSSAEQVLQVLPQPDEVEQTATGLHLNQEVNVARGPGVSSRHRTENANVMSAVLSGISQYLLPPIA
jgi:hypothetical protein